MSRHAALSRRRDAAQTAVMINDVLDFARGHLDSGVPLTPRPTDMRAICADIADELGEAHPGRQIRFEVKGDVTGGPQASTRRMSTRGHRR